MPAMTKEEQEAYDDALRMIEACRRDSWMALDLSRLGLTAVPAEMGQLFSLTKLDLSCNQLTAVPRR